jgi:hypothetical protein
VCGVVWAKTARGSFLGVVLGAGSWELCYVLLSALPN